MSEVRISEDGYGLILDFYGSKVEIGMPEANMLQEQIRGALVESGCTMMNAVGGKIVMQDQVLYANNDDAELKGSLAILLGVDPKEIIGVEPTGYRLSIQTKPGDGCVMNYSRRVELS